MYEQGDMGLDDFNGMNDDLAKDDEGKSQDDKGTKNSGGEWRAN
mgnify:CR=1 FL=1